MALQRRSLAALNLRSTRKIDAESRDDPVSRSLQQDPGQLGIAQHQVIRPFEDKGCAGRLDPDGLDQRQSGHQRQCRRRRIGRAKLDQSRAAEVAVYRLPRPAMPALAAFLPERDQPIAFDRLIVRQQGTVRRPQPVDDADSGQNRLPAALPVNSPSGPINR